MTRKHTLVESEAKEDYEGTESPDEVMEAAAGRRNMQREARHESETVAVVQGAALDTYVEVWSSTPGDLNIPHDEYVQVLKLLRYTSTQQAVSQDITRALLTTDNIGDRVASLRQLLATEPIPDCTSNSQDIQIFVDVLWEVFETEDKIQSWLEWVCDPEFGEETPLAYYRFYQTIQNLCAMYTYKPLDMDHLQREISYNLPADYPIYRSTARRHRTGVVFDVWKWLRPVRRKRTPPPPSSPRTSEWYQDIVQADLDSDVLASWKRPSPSKPHWHVRLFLKRPLPGVNPWFTREGDVRRSWFMTKRHPITHIE